ncbi:capsule assembly Wzi family protein [Sporomusa sphaeroides]|uniref:capsule assembly Wzi family protein n=1 Tax=Sporomusa sphaeroides TaxID=47679 RepID=UPI002D1FB8D3|nr:capsule assembly Wzi family protein [Sporomusa sphaeroides]
MVSWKKSLAASMVMAVMAAGVQAAPSDWVSPNVPLSSPLYGYVEKFDGLGYLTSLPDGTKPYTRMQMAKWLTEIQTAAEQRPLPAYLAGIKQIMERELAPELQVLAGESVDMAPALKEVRLELADYSGDFLRYRANGGPRASQQPLNSNNNGYRYGQNGNAVASFLLTGKLGEDVAVALEPRFSYDGDQHGDAALNSGYIKTRINGTSIQVGKDPVFWGHGATGSLILGNNMTPLTSIQLSNLESYTSRGFFRFLGEMNFTALYSELENDRTRFNEKEVDNPSFVGLRGTFTPQQNFTFGLSLTSMLGGKGKGLNRSDWKHWFVGRNDEAGEDKWNNIAGLDFKVRVPKWNGVQVYGELYGEDQANYMPSRVAERVGVYIPRLSQDGRWDMKVEFLNTTNAWYNHQLYTNGYVYKGDIIGDPAGHNARQYYLQLGNFLDADSKISLNAKHVKQDRTASSPQTINSLWLQYQTQLREQVFLDSRLGITRTSNANFTGGHDETDHFAGASVHWVF